MRERLEAVGAAFLVGYHAALERGEEGLTAALDEVELERRGFAYEGAAMGLALIDCLSPWGMGRWRRFLCGAAEPHAYMAHVGAGWVWARVPWARRRLRAKMDPLLEWLAFDGWGFHEGFFRWRQYIAGQPPPRGLAGYEQRAFDQGLGRSWWFVNGGRPELLTSTFAAFSPQRHADLWSGVGLAATYAGQVAMGALEGLRELAGPHWPALAQGAVFATKARERAGNLTTYTTSAIVTLAGLSVTEAVRLCDEACQNLPTQTAEPAYEIWRRRVQHGLGALRPQRGAFSPAGRNENEPGGAVPAPRLTGNLAATGISA